jgi:hypothetical protein
MRRNSRRSQRHLTRPMTPRTCKCCNGTLACSVKFRIGWSQRLIWATRRRTFGPRNTQILPSFWDWVPARSMVSYTTCSTVGNTNQRRAGKGITVSGNYAFSHCITDPNPNQPFAVGGTESYSNPYSRRFDRGNCILQSVDVRHALKVSAVLDTPQFSNKGLRAVASGWRVSPIFRALTGDHMSVASGQDNALNGGSGSAATPTSGMERANQVLENPYGNKTVNNFLNPAAFRLPALGTLGNMGVGAIEDPGSWVIDTAISRILQVRESQKVELRFEAFQCAQPFSHDGSGHEPQQPASGQSHSSNGS